MVNNVRAGSTQSTGGRLGKTRKDWANKAASTSETSCDEAASSRMDANGSISGQVN